MDLSATPRWRSRIWGAGSDPDIEPGHVVNLTPDTFGMLRRLGYYPRCTTCGDEAAYCPHAKRAGINAEPEE